MSRTARVGLLVLPLLLAAAACAGGDPGGNADDAGEAAAARAGRLVSFGSCGDLLGYAKTQATRLVGPWGVGAGGMVGMPLAAAADAARESAAPQAGVDYSGTNVQEEGVDEPDIVKTDGRTLFAVSNGMLKAVDVGGRRPLLLDTLKLDEKLGFDHELLLHGSRLLLLSRGGYWAEPLPAMARGMIAPVPSESVIAEVDVSDPGDLRVVRTLTLDGSYLSARLVGGSARIVSSAFVPQELAFEQPTTGTEEDLAQATERNREIVASSRVSDWLPRYRLARADGTTAADRPLVQCRSVRRPAAFSGLGMLTVLTVDLARGLEPVDSTAVMTDGRVVYASPESLYVATERWLDRPDPNAPDQAKGGVTTAMHKFDISSPTKTAYRGSGRVAGYLLNQWSLSEHRGVLRVVSTESPAWWGPADAEESESFLTTLRQQDGGLVQIARIGGLGKGERVYAVRFMGDVGYVVTFRQIDPLYTVDLSDPERPRVLGELKIPGYSAYLHPIGEDLLLGIGQDATEDGRPTGTQLSVFDVSDLRRPTRLHRAALGQGWSEAEWDHHAFLHWPRTGLVVVPFNQGAVGVRVGRARGIERVGGIEHPAAQELGYVPGIRRSLVVRDAVLTVSDAGVEASSLATLAELGWVAFPQPEPPVGESVPPEPAP